MPVGLDIQTISDIYLESHTLTHASTQVKGDDAVNFCLDSQLECETHWTHKISHTVQSEAIYNAASQESEFVSMPLVKDNIKKSLKETTSNFWLDHVKSLSIQGRFLELISLEENAIH